MANFRAIGGGFVDNIKTEEISCYLSSLTWNTSGGGKYYAIISTSDFDPTNKIIMSVCIGFWQGLRATDVIQPCYLQTSGLMLISNVNSFFNNQSNVSILITYREY